MFSGLTSQLSSWMSFVGSEQAANPIEDTSATFNSVKTDSNITEGSKFDIPWVKREICRTEEWLDYSFSKFIKNGDSDTLDGGKPLDGGEITPTLVEYVNVANLGSDPMAKTPTEQTDTQFENIQNKAIDGTKLFGKFLYSAVNKARKILDDFNEEQKIFLKIEVCINITNPLPPWAGCPNEGDLKEACLAISTDIRNFVRNPPVDVDFNFDYEVSYPIAMAIMEQDPNLEKIRYKLVPKVINEENFWRNYFYCVKLLCQRNDLSHMPNDADSQLATDMSLPGPSIDSQVTEISCNGFMSDTLQICSEHTAELLQSMKNFIFTPENNEEVGKWEQNLEAEPPESGDCKSSKTGSHNKSWKQEVDALLMNDGSL